MTARTISFIVGNASSSSVAAWRVKHIYSRAGGDDDGAGCSFGRQTTWIMIAAVNVYVCMHYIYLHYVHGICIYIYIMILCHTRKSRPVRVVGEGGVVAYIENTSLVYIYTTLRRGTEVKELARLHQVCAAHIYIYLDIYTQTFAFESSHAPRPSLITRRGLTASSLYTTTIIRTSRTRGRDRFERRDGRAIINIIGKAPPPPSDL